MKTNLIFKSFFLVAILASAAFASKASAQEYVLGAHVGGLGVSEGSSSGVAYGPFFRANPLGWAAFEVDATFARLSGENYFSSSPALILYPLATEDFGLGFIFGPGFYKIGNQDLKFGLSVGLGADFAVAKNFSIGMETRYHPVFQSADVWSVFVNLGFRFEGSNDW